MTAVTTTTPLARLTATTAPASRLLHPRGPLETGIVHLGLGNFHRAHQAVYTAAALAEQDGPWGILGVASRSAAVADALREQDFRYCTVQISPTATTLQIPAVHTGALVATQAPDAVLDAIAAPATRIVTITVTEHGYTYSPVTHRLDVENPAVQTDLRGDAAPTTTIGQIVRGLQRRVRGGGAPITVLSCDNLTGNGSHTRRLVSEFVAELPATEREELAGFLGTAVTFPNCMVDRIVPATVDRYRRDVADQLALRDEIPVPAEPFTMWVLEDSFAAGRPAWERSGAIFSDDVESYELLKLRLLNGTHSLIAYLGALDGRAIIPDSVAQPFVADAARTVLYQDYLPSVPVPADVDLDAYVEQLFQRWSNTALGHGTHQVGSDGSVKLAQRIPVPALLQLRAGAMPHHLALTVAAYLQCLAPPAGFDSGRYAAAMSDPARAGLATLAATHPAPATFVRSVLDTGLLGTDLAGRPEFVARVAEFRTILTRHGPAAAAAEAQRSAALPVIA